MCFCHLLTEMNVLFQQLSPVCTRFKTDYHTNSTGDNKFFLLMTVFLTV